MLQGVLAGLAHAEGHGIVHRDVKPENVMVTVDGGVKIADFGIAKATTQLWSGTSLTTSGVTLGTPAYIAPEQAMGQPVGPASDLYSVGCMAHELFTGRPPFDATEAPMAILLRHVRETPPAAADVAPGVDVRISDWIGALLRKDPDARPQRAEEAWRHLEDIVLAIEGPRWRRGGRLASPPRFEANEPGPVLVADEPPPVVVANDPPAARRSHRRPRVAAATVAVLGLVTALVATLPGGPEPGRRRPLPWSPPGSCGSSLLRAGPG